MTIIDVCIFIAYLLGVLGVGVYFHYKNTSQKEFFQGDKNISAWHIGLSVVATDVGGGFSIGLGGLGFMIGISGAWMLFTGLIGAWLSAVFLIPVVFRRFNTNKLLTFPQLLAEVFGSRVALMAGIISFIGYLGFTASQLLAGAKLAVGTFPILKLEYALLIMGIVAVAYTSFGGIKAVIYTDTFQWIILMLGLIFIGLPFAYVKLGGFEKISSVLPPEFFQIDNVSWVRLANWFVTIVPIWFVGMTLYQRIFASKSSKDAQKAWFIAGLFEFPVMAIMGVTLGLFARVAAEIGMFAQDGFLNASQMDAELGLPMLLRHILPVGLIGLMLSAYFSAIMSTADSCLLAASGNLMTDLFKLDVHHPRGMKYAQLSTAIVGLLALLIATLLTSVLKLMLLSYAFMVAGMFIPVLIILLNLPVNTKAAFWSMIIGGSSTLILNIAKITLPYGFNPIILGLILSSLTYLIGILTTRYGSNRIA